MAYREIWHEMIIKASPSELYQALTDVKKTSALVDHRDAG